MPDHEIGEPIKKDILQPEPYEVTPLNDFQLRKEEVNNESTRQQLINQYDDLMDQYNNRPTEDLAIALLNLRKEIDLIGANESEIIDAQRGIKHPRKNEILN